MKCQKIKRTESGDNYSVALECIESAEYRMVIDESAYSADLSTGVTKDAIEAAVYSGLLYTWRSLGKPNIEVRVKNIEGNCLPLYVEGYAISAMCSVAQCLGHEDRLDDLVTSEWQMV